VTKPKSDIPADDDTIVEIGGRGGSKFRLVGGIFKTIREGVRLLAEINRHLHNANEQRSKLMAQIDDLNTAVTGLTAAVAALPGRVATPDLTTAIKGVTDATDALNAINPAPVAPAPTGAGTISPTDAGVISST
jgi:hypothetical protein